MAAQIGAQCRSNRSVRGGSDFAGLAFERQKITLGQAGLKQPGLAHARLAGQQHNSTSPPISRDERLLQRGLFAGAPNQIIVVAHGQSSYWRSCEHEMRAQVITERSIPMSPRRVQKVF